jgi:hypothetical protein
MTPLIRGRIFKPGGFSGKFLEILIIVLLVSCKNNKNSNGLKIRLAEL